MTKHTVSLLLCIMTFVMMGCSAGQPIRILKDNETVITGSVGGPVVPAKVPTLIVPYLTAGIMHGISENITVHANLHALLSAFAVAGIDVGASTRLVHEQGIVPEITATARLLMFSDFRSFASSRIYPDVSVTASYEVAKRWLVYGGLHNTFQFTAPSYLVSPYVGSLVPLSDRFSLQAEFTWQAANVDTHSGVFEGRSSIGGHGSAGFFLGGAYTL